MAQRQSCQHDLAAIHCVRVAPSKPHLPLTAIGIDGEPPVVFWTAASAVQPLLLCCCPSRRAADRRDAACCTAGLGSPVLGR